ncbi:MAG: serine/threonine protein kinase, partial [Deltaproteobacteria bacterium]|nr:serine/threonine protein kinase [Deltaproteobacteria bacterium]
MSTEIAPLSPADDDPREKLIGTVLASRYRIEMRLGEGAMGTVYKATHVKVGRAFAVKVLHSKLLEDLKVAQRFEREAELAGRLRHANVIGVVDVGETPDGLRYMVMDFAEGEDLAEVLSEAPMPAARIINLTRQLLEGLYHAHEQGLIHRDFKPENVIIEKDMHGIEVPRIVDFGIAILREGGDSPSSEGRLTTNGLVLGTPHYMAPEQAVADPIDHRIDLFALGIVVYEMLCGKLPFDGTGAEVARANLLLDPPAIAHRVPHLEVDPLLEAFARQMMAKRREQRPPTAKAARVILDLIEKDRPAAAAALGVSVGVGTRAQQPTEDLPAQPRHTHEDSSSDQFDAQPDPRLPPPVAAAGPPAGLATERAITTSKAQPLDFEDELPRSSTRTWVFAGIGLVVAGGLAAFLLGRGGDDSPASRADDTKVATTPTAPDPPTVTPITPDNIVDKVPVVAVVPDKPTPDKPTPDKPALTKPTPDKLMADKNG